MSSALVMRELAEAQPSYFYPYIIEAFKHIFLCLYDAKLSVRQAGAHTLRVCLSLWKDRALYPGIYRKIETGLQDKKEERWVLGKKNVGEVFISSLNMPLITTTHPHFSPQHPRCIPGLGSLPRPHWQLCAGDALL